MEKLPSIIENLKQELRRGSLVLTALLLLETPKYGYAMVQELEEEGIHIDQSTLYPLLRRLEKQTLISSDWSVGESRPRKYYQLTKDGLYVRKALLEEWRFLSEAILRLEKKGEKK